MDMPGQPHPGEGPSVCEVTAATDLRENYVRRLFQQICKHLGVSGQLVLVRRAEALPWR